MNKKHLFVVIALLLFAIIFAFIWYSGMFRGGNAGGWPPSGAIIGDVGFFNTVPNLQTDGNLSFNLSQDIGQTMYNIGMACTAMATNTTPPRFPNPPTAMVYLSSNGSATNIPANGPARGALTLSNLQKVTVTGLKCFNQSGSPLSNPINIGTLFDGYLWINYTLGSGVPTGTGGANPMITSTFGYVEAKVINFS